MNMKTFRLIGMGLIAVLMSFTIASCGDDEEDDSTIENPNKPNLSTDKRLVQVKVEYYEGHGVDHVDFELEYDNHGRVISLIEYEEDGTIDNVHSIKYSENSIILTGKTDYLPSVTTFIVGDGRIVAGTEDGDHGYYTHTHSYSYNSYNYLNEIKGDLGERTFTWSENKLIETKDYIDKSRDHYYFEYDNKTCKGYNPAIISWGVVAEEEDLIFTFIAANPELIGFKTNHLPKRAIAGDEYVNFSYELDDDGYLKKCVEVANNGEDPKAYTFVWE